MLIIHEGAIADSARHYRGTTCKAGQNIGNAVGSAVGKVTGQVIGRPLAAAGTAMGTIYGGTKGLVKATGEKFRTWQGKGRLKKYVKDQNGEGEEKKKKR